MGNPEKIQVYRDRVAADPYDAAGWERLLAEISRGRKSDEQHAQLREVYEDLVSKFPTAGAYWREYCELEMDNGSPDAAKALFSRCLLNCLDVDLWRAYLRFIRRLNDPRGAEALPEIRQSLEFALDHIGQDLRSGPIWQEYVTLLAQPKLNTPEHEALFGAAPEGQEDAQRTAALRRAYHRALLVPSSALDTLWTGYERFESGTGNKTLAKRSLDEWRPKFQAAKTQMGERSRLVERIDFRALPLPPGRGGPKQARQAAAWREYIHWERSNAQELDAGAYHSRVTLAYEQCLGIFLQFPDVWLDFAAWHAVGGGVGPVAGTAVLHRGRAALPGALALHFAAAEAEEAAGALDKAKEVFETLVDTLTASVTTPIQAPVNNNAAPPAVPDNSDPAPKEEPDDATPSAEKTSAGEEELTTIEDAPEVPPQAAVTAAAALEKDGQIENETHQPAAAMEDAEEADPSGSQQADDAAEAPAQAPPPAPATAANAAALGEERTAPSQDLVVAEDSEEKSATARTVFSPEAGTLIWIQYMRFIRRVEGMMSARKMFMRARKWSGLRWHAFAASAAMEWAHEAKDQIPRNIFELGLKTHMEEPAYVLEYARFLRSLGDVANCRALFERAIMATPPAATMPLWDAYLRLEAETGTLVSTNAVLKRRREALEGSGTEDIGVDAARIAVLKYRFLDLWPGAEAHFRAILGGEDAALLAAGAALPTNGASLAPDLEDEKRRMPSKRRPRSRSRSRSPMRGRRVPVDSHQPIRRFPRELGLLLNQLSLAPDGPIPELERVVEVILRADFSPEGIEAHEAAAARERRRQRHAAEHGGLAPSHAGFKRKAPYEGGPAGVGMMEESDTESSEDEDGGLGMGLDVYRRRMRART